VSTGRTVEEDNSLPASIFHHHFQTRPPTVEDYHNFLLELSHMGVFLLDICDDPIRVRDCPEGEKRVIAEIPLLRGKLAARRIVIPDAAITFLLARKGYARHIRLAFPDARRITWKDFRLSNEPSGPHQA